MEKFIIRKKLGSLHLGGENMKVVHIAAVCQNKSKVLESLKKNGHPVQRVYLVLWDKFAGEKEVEDLRKNLRAVAEVERIDVCDLEVDAMVDELLKIVNKELDNGNEVLLNSTESPEILHFVFYTTAHLSSCKLYTGIPTEDRQGIGEVLKVPVVPCKPLDDDKLKIIKILHREGDELESLDKLIHLFEMESNTKGLQRIGP